MGKKKIARLQDNTERSLWSFTGKNDASFVSYDSTQHPELYFPLLNAAGMKSWVTPELKGDICLSFGQYLTPPTVTEEIRRTNTSRNIWISTPGNRPWSVTGMSAWQKAARWGLVSDEMKILGKPGAFTLSNTNNILGLSMNITIFIPSSGEQVELLLIEVENISNDQVEFDLTYSVPVFARHADNFRDHRQVTTMFQQNYRDKYGVRIKPKIIHDEHGHTPNNTSYLVYGFDHDGSPPDRIWNLMQDFTGKYGSLDNPAALFNGEGAPDEIPELMDGQEAVAALGFKRMTVPAGSKTCFGIIHGITDHDTEREDWVKKFGNPGKIKRFLATTLDNWQEYTDSIRIHTADHDFDMWVKWIIYQVKCRQVFGNSFLPDFSYGRGGRGWRDLWQDLLSIFLVDPESAREEIINSLKGIRIDGSNATIIGTKPGEFIADRNNVPRTWCDHGAWPAYVINFYIQQTGDYDILFGEIPFWKDRFAHRSRKIDEKYEEKQGNWQFDRKGNRYESTIFEHLLIQQYSAYYHVGEHNILLLEGGDWNDTYDMARERGESVGFYAFYARNMLTLAGWLHDLRSKGINEIYLLKEIAAMVGEAELKKMNSAAEKQQYLQEYFSMVAHDVSGEKVKVSIDALINDLTARNTLIMDIISESEWVRMDDDAGFFNGHYDNRGQAVDGIKGQTTRIDLTTQVMATMHGLASEEQLDMMLQSTNTLLKKKGGKGYRLCTAFDKVDMDIGRITGFIYGHKEHGSKWMQQNIMFAHGLYSHGRQKQAYRLINEIYTLCTDSNTSLTYPGIPSYFAPGDRGRYSYLTGSSTWMLLTLHTRMFGFRGEKGDLLIQPQMDTGQFDDKGHITVEFTFAGQRIKATYHLEKGTTNASLMVERININKLVPIYRHNGHNSVIIPREELISCCNEELNQMNIYLKPGIPTF